jgi:hypothetical protein
MKNFKGMGLILLALLLITSTLLSFSCVSIQSPDTKTPKATSQPEQPTGNRPPVISSLKSGKSSVYALESTDVQVVVSDPDGDKVNLTWQCSGGKIVGTGYVVTWQAPNANGSYEITVIADDGKGSSQQNTIKINVGANQPPQISSLTADPQTLGPTGRSTLTCVAVDPEGSQVNYSWKPQAGDITGQGSKVTWIAPNKGGTFNIIVSVDDGKGGVSERSIAMTVALSTKSVSIPLTKEESGTVTSEGDKDKSFYRAGDNEKDIGFAAFFSFNIYSLQRNEIKEAKLVFGSSRIAGAPFTVVGSQSLGGLQIFKFNWGNALPSYNAIGDRINFQSQAMFSEPNSLDVTPEVGYLVSSGADRFQVFLRFLQRTNNDFTAEWIDWNDARLDITYTEK